MSFTHFQSANLPHGGLFLPPRAGRQVMELAFFTPTPEGSVPGLLVGAHGCQRNLAPTGTPFQLS